MFDAKVIESLTPEGKPRIDLDLNGLSIYIVQPAPGEDPPASPPGRYLGLDHFGLLVKNMDETVAELKRRGAEFAAEPVTVRPGLRIAFIRGPENVRIEIAERT
jgi:catechol 2,3-dioxygenase-like lactoylglutathione lyase family enzyme